MLEAKEVFPPTGWRAAATYLNAARCKADSAWQKTLVRANAWRRRKPAAPEFVDKLELSFVVGGEPLVDVTRVDALPNHQLRLEFSNGRRALVSMASCLNEAPFDRLTEADFALAHIAHGTVAWPNAIEIAPETLLDLCRDN